MKCIKPGLFTTIQDLGRFKHEKDGFSVAGVMNQYLYKIATTLVENENSPVLEVTLNGPSLKINTSNIIAFVAYDAQILLDNVEIPTNTAIYVERGQILQIKQITKGARGYLAFHKQMEIEPILGSVSTHTRSGIGGYTGKPMKSNDTLCFKDRFIKQDVIGNSINLNLDNYQNVIPIVKGLQYEQFTNNAHEILVNQTYEISGNSDRMGYRLLGEEKLTHIHDADIISEPIAPGSVQVPNNGQPIILLNDRQTIGGYTKIATLTYIGRERVALLKPNDTLRFKWITIEEAMEAYKTYISELKSSLISIRQKKFKDLHYTRPKSKQIAKLIKG